MNKIVVLIYKCVVLIAGVHVHIILNANAFYVLVFALRSIIL